MYDSDRNSLEEFKETVQQVKDLGDQLDSEKAELEEMNQEYQNRQASMQTQLEEKKATSSDYDAQIAQAQNQAAQYTELIRQQNAEIRKIEEEEKKAAEEAARKAAEEAAKKAAAEEAAKKAQEEANKKAADEAAKKAAEDLKAQQDAAKKQEEEAKKALEEAQKAQDAKLKEQEEKLKAEKDKYGFNEKTTLKSAKVKGKKVTLKWNKVKGASGYEIYCKTGKGKWKLVKTLNKGSKASYKLKGKAGKKYTYKVRVFQKVENKVIYGQYSNTKSAKIKK